MRAHRLEHVERAFTLTRLFNEKTLATLPVSKETADEEQSNKEKKYKEFFWGGLFWTSVKRGEDELCCYVCYYLKCTELLFEMCCCIVRGCRVSASRVSFRIREWTFSSWRRSDIAVEEETRRHAAQCTL
ncbi:hypothetical protein NDU88_006293 [Pleurodeles waltl]|uniref:Uncharacterized protein n=1 Tax=Pleurodeles waltl TaxID=8319 RepID=A0AAV7SPC4_PLEWA|nr:hypothetical protein NDU88_006293 [Pleurodeles waltl]